MKNNMDANEMNNIDLANIMDDFSRRNGDKCYLYRNRPYFGQPQTDNGTRGKTEVHGVTFRDIKDAFIMAAFDAGNDQDPTGKNFDSERTGRVSFNDIHKLDLNRIDPIAWQQNMSCRIEKMMGIFPNIPKLEFPTAPGEYKGE